MSGVRHETTFTEVSQECTRSVGIESNNDILEENLNMGNPFVNMQIDAAVPQLNDEAHSDKTQFPTILCEKSSISMEENTNTCNNRKKSGRMTLTGHWGHTNAGLKAERKGTLNSGPQTSTPGKMKVTADMAMTTNYLTHHVVGIASEVITSKTPPNDVIKITRKNYSNEPQKYDSSMKIKSRNLNRFGYMTEKTERWETKRARQLLALRQGEFASKHIPYFSLGEIELEPNRLFLKSVEQSLPNWLIKYSGNLTKTHSQQIASVAKIKDAKLAKQAAKDTKKLELLQREKLCDTAGMNAILDQINETEARRKVTRTGQTYLRHVTKCQNRKKKEKMKQRQAFLDKHCMLIKKLSSHTLLTSIRVHPHEMYNDKRNSFSEDSNTELLTKYYHLQRRINDLADKLASTYDILCALYNMKCRYLKQRQPLSIEHLKSLRRDPFAVDHLDLKGIERKQRNSADIIVASSRLNLGLNSPHDSLKRESFSTPKDSQFGSANLAGLLRPNRGGSKRKGRLTIVPYDNLPKIETWEDIVSVQGSKMKNNRSLKKNSQSPTPWQQIAKEDIIAQSTKDSGERSEEEYDPENAVPNMHKCFVTVKEHYDKKANNDIDKMTRHRVVKFKSKMKVMEVPMFLYQYLEDSARISHEASKDPTLITEIMPPWYEKLLNEAEELDAKKEENIERPLLNLKKFVLEDFSLMSNALEKLCLLTISMPVYEVLTPPVQDAIKFVLNDILGFKETLLKEWLTHRKLYVIDDSSRHDDYINVVQDIVK